MARQDIESPCVRVCAVDGRSGLCLGCGRTLREIGGWTRYTDEERREIMSGLPARLDGLETKQAESSSA